MRTSKLMTAMFALLLASVAAAQEGATVDGFFPACGSAGDPVVIRGSGFADEPSVQFGETAAEVVRSRDDAVLVRVPEDLSAGPLSITVDGAAALDDFTAMADDAPVVLRASADTATPDQPILLIGRRLDGATATFVDADGADAGTVPLVGGRRAGHFRVPDDLAAGDYTLRVENGAGATTGPCSPSIEIVEAGEPMLDAAEPEGALPGRHLTLTGTDLAPAGPCRVLWDDGSGGDPIVRLGFSNGFHRVHTRVPGTAASGTTYTVSIDLRGDAPETNGIEYTVGEPDAPEITALDPDAGPAGSLFTITGTDLLLFGSETTVEFRDGDAFEEARVLSFRPGLHGHDDALLVRVPADLADGDYDVRVKVGEQESDAATFAVGALPLVVTAMHPDRQGTRGRLRPVFLEGTGFGRGGLGATPIAVEWDDGATIREGRVIFRADRLLVVLVPGDVRDPLPAGTYTVTVVLDPDGAPESAKAGTYTVE